MKSFKKNTILIFLITVFVLYFILKDDFSNIIHELLHINIMWLIVAFGCFLIYTLCKAESLRMVAVKNDKNFTFKQSFMQNLIVHFFNGITPFQMGGQPMQIYKLTQNKMSITKATNVVIQEFIFYQVALVLLGIFAVGLNSFYHFFNKVHFLQVLVVLGFLFNVIIVLLLLLASFNKKITKFIIMGVVSIFCRFKIIRNKDKMEQKVDKKLLDFHENAKYLLYNKKMFLKGVFVNLVGLLFFYITPLFIAYGMGIYPMNVIKVITASAYVYLVGSFVPLPGSSGGLEYSFIRFFGNFINGSVLPAILIIYLF